MFRRQKKSKRNTQLDTLIGQYTRLEGGITFSGGLRVEGCVKGDVTAEEEDSLLTVSEDGTIEGQVKVPYIILSGSVTGDVHATEHIELTHQAQIHGDVYYYLIEIAMGAKINGNLIHIEEKPAPKLALTARLETETIPPKRGLTESKT
jgi:cytoskeletal protein CcmA (bactofilin family)